MARIALYAAAALGMAMALIFGAQAATRVPLAPLVVDGDTIKLNSGKRIRAMGYDTPEKGTLAKCDAERDLAAKATERMKELMGYPHVVTLKYAKGKDKYGRGLAWIYSDKKPVGPILISEGLAHPYDVHTGKTSWCGTP